MDMGKEEIKTEAANCCWMHYSVLASVNIIEFQTALAYSGSDLIMVKYNICTFKG
jgi:hypothetical protein